MLLSQPCQPPPPKKKGGHGGGEENEKKRKNANFLAEMTENWAIFSEFFVTENEHIIKRIFSADPLTFIRSSGRKLKTRPTRTEHPN